jgi:uncharacterized protein YcaQ
MMLEALWAKGEVMIVGRQGQQRVWDLAERRLPMDHARLTSTEVAREVLDRQLRAAGVTTLPAFGHLLDGARPDGWDRALARLVRDGVAVPARIEGVRGAWYAHAETLEAAWRPRTALLSPFDRLIHERRRTQLLFGFRYRLEIYVPAAERQYGYFVLPILHGDRLVGRVDPTFDRREGVLRVRAVWAEDGAPSEAGAAIADQVRSLARWLGASDIVIGDVPAVWGSHLRSLGR